MLTKRTETERAGSCSLHAVGSARGMARPLSIESPGDLQPPEGRVLSEIRPPQRRAPAKPLPDCARLPPDRDDAIRAAYASRGCTLKGSRQVLEFTMRGSAASFAGARV
jgi:hypothetical protein